jgi:hypothetical protein
MGSMMTPRAPIAPKVKSDNDAARIQIVWERAGRFHRNGHGTAGHSAKSQRSPTALGPVLSGNIGPVNQT